MEGLPNPCIIRGGSKSAGVGCGWSEGEAFLLQLGVDGFESEVGVLSSRSTVSRLDAGMPSMCRRLGSGAAAYTEALVVLTSASAAGGAAASARRGLKEAELTEAQVAKRDAKAAAKREEKRAAKKAKRKAKVLDEATIAARKAKFQRKKQRRAARKEAA